MNVTEDTETYVRPGNDCAGEIILCNSILIASGSDVKDFLADNIEHFVGRCANRSPGNNQNKQQQTSSEIVLLGGVG